MNAHTHLAKDGYVDAIPVPGTGWGTATFDLIHSPADADTIAPDTPDTVYARTTANPDLANVLLREIQLGDLLHITGTITQPTDPDARQEAAPDPAIGSSGFRTR